MVVVNLLSQTLGLVDALEHDPAFEKLFGAYGCFNSINPQTFFKALTSNRFPQKPGRLLKSLDEP